MQDKKVALVRLFLGDLLSLLTSLINKPDDQYNVEWQVYESLDED
jgi:hypothetical protein